MPTGDAFEALSNRHRRQMLDLIAQHPRRAGELADAFPQLVQPAVSRHLRVLREAGLVNVHRRAQQRIYSIRREGLQDVAVWLRPYARFIDARLESLSEYLTQRRVDRRRRNE